MFIIAAIFFVMSLSTGSALAASSDAELRDCRVLVVASERLACYDAIPLAVPLAKPVVPKKTATPPSETKLAPVNTVQPQLGSKYLAKKDREIQTPVTASKKLIDAKKDSKKRWEFYFADGQVWRQVEARYLSKPALPAQATISEGMLGRHVLSINDNSKSTKVKRIR